MDVGLIKLSTSLALFQLVGFATATLAVEPRYISNSATQKSPSDNSVRSTVTNLSGCPVFAIDQINLPAQETGVLTSMPIGAGQDIIKNTLIATLDNEAVLMEQSVGQLQLRIARELAQDPTDVLFAAAVVQEAKINLETTKELLTRFAATEAEIRAKQLGVEQAELKLQQARMTQKQLGAKADLAAKTLAAMTQRLDRFTIKAPFDATVQSIDKRTGEWVQAGTSVVTLVRLDELRVDAFVSFQEQSPSQLVGRSVWVEMPIAADCDAALGNQPERLAGKITHYDPAVTGTGSIRIHATIQNTRRNGHWQLLPGMLVQMQIH